MDQKQKKGVARLVVEKSWMRLEFEVPDVSVSELSTITKGAKAAVDAALAPKAQSAS